jgi:photosynthetic reaction center cytochrome c subunit
MMTSLVVRKVAFVTTALSAMFLCLWGVLAITPAQTNSTTGAPKTAAEQFKNIQVLKDIPADQLIPTMQFITSSLGVDCNFCHVEHEMQKDDKKTKQTARKMIAMELAINKAHFDNQIEVTCYTCHRGSAHPVGTPILSADMTAASAGSGAHEHEESDSEKANLPPADEIFSRYLNAIGGTVAIEKINSRVETGTLQAEKMQAPITVYSEAPAKRISISRMGGGPSVTAYNGQVGWLTIPNGIHMMTQPERQAARIDAELSFPAHLSELYKEFAVKPGEEIDGHTTYLLIGKDADPLRPVLRLYFDRLSGLLLRQMRLAQTPLGKNPTQVDYADYREVGGVKIPYRWTLSRPNGSFTIQVNDVKQNVPIDAKLFEAPSQTTKK